jgi:hypothetical protein
MSDAQNITKKNGPGMYTAIGDYVFNTNSSLKRQWITIHSDIMPIKINDTIGVIVSGDKDLKYYSEYNLVAKEPIKAVEIRFLLFNIWGEHYKTLSATLIIDLGSDVGRVFESEWNTYSINDLSEFYASIAYIARARTAEGQVINADSKIVLKEAKKFSEKFSEKDLEPTPNKK